MSLKIATFGLSIGNMLYQMIDGGIVRVPIIPIAGYCLKKAGEYFRSRSMQSMADAAIVGSVLAFPGATVGYAIDEIGEQTALVKTISYVAGVVITGLVCKGMLVWGAQSVPTPQRKKPTPPAGSPPLRQKPTS